MLNYIMPSKKKSSEISNLLQKARSEKLSNEVIMPYLTSYINDPLLVADILNKLVELGSISMEQQLALSDYCAQLGEKKKEEENDNEELDRGLSLFEDEKPEDIGREEDFFEEEKDDDGQGSDAASFFKHLGHRPLLNKQEEQKLTTRIQECFNKNSSYLSRLQMTHDFVKNLMDQIINLKINLSSVIILDKEFIKNMANDEEETGSYLTEQVLTKMQDYLNIYNEYLAAKKKRKADDQKKIILSTLEEKLSNSFLALQLHQNKIKELDSSLEELIKQLDQAQEIIQKCVKNKKKKDPEAVKKLEEIESALGMTSEEFKSIYSRMKIIREAGNRAMQLMLESNYRLVINLAKKYVGRGLPFADLVQEGLGGLIKAIYKFDPKQGNKFCTYAMWWGTQAMIRALYQLLRLIKTPVHIMEINNEISRFVRSYVDKHGKQPMLEDISETLNIPLFKVRFVLDSSRMMSSLDRTMNGDDTHASMGDFIPDPRKETEIDEFIGEEWKNIRNIALASMTPSQELFYRNAYVSSSKQEQEDKKEKVKIKPLLYKFLFRIRQGQWW